MMLARVDHEPRRKSESAQRLRQLFAAVDRHVEILAASQKQRRRVDAVRMKERVGHLEPQRLVLPRWPEFIVVLQIVLVAAVHRDLIRAAGAADGGLET